MSALVAAATLAARGSGGRSSVSGVVATVFGATGFLGGYVTNQLGRIGSQVVVPYRGDELYSRHLKVMGDLGQIVPLPFELRDEDSVRDAIRGSNVVVNLLGKHYETRNYSFDDVHVERTHRMAEIAAEEGVPHFVHVSANAPVGKCDSAWLKSKIEGEAAVRDVFPDATIVRPTDIFGAEDRFLIRMAVNVTQLPAVPLANGGESRVQPVWVNDVASVVAAAARDPEGFSGRTFELGGPEILTVEECYEMVLKMTRHKASFIPLPAFATEFGAKFTSMRIPILNPNPLYTPDAVKMEVAENVLDTEKEGVLHFKDLDAVALSVKSDIAKEMLRRFMKGGDRASDLFYVD